MMDLKQVCKLDEFTDLIRVAKVSMDLMRDQCARVYHYISHQQNHANKWYLGGGVVVASARSMYSLHASAIHSAQ